MGGDGLRTRRFILVGAAARDSRRGISRTNFHRFPRLRPLILLQVEASQQRDGRHRGIFEPHSVSALALAACFTSRDRGRSGSTRLGRHLDADRAGIYREYALAALCVSACAQSARTIHNRAAICICRPSSICSIHGARARAPIRSAYELGVARNHGLDERHDRIESISFDSADRFRICRRRRSLVVLRATSIRGRLLVAIPGLELHGCGAAGQLILQAAENPAVVHRQYRFSSYTSSEPSNSELPPSAMS